MTTPLAPQGLIGMVHLEALPGTPKAKHPPRRIIERAVEDALVLAEAGFDAILVENMLDAPYLLRDVGPEIVAVMTAATTAIVQIVDVPVGVQVLAGANKAALAIAHAAGGQFIRAEGFAYASVADEGILAEADAGPLLRHRRAIGAEQIAIWADVRKKHSAHALTGDLSLGQLVAGTAFCGADAVIVTGHSTGEPVAKADLDEARNASDLPVVVGSGATPDDLPELLARADAVIVGSWIKVDGNWRNPVDPQRASAFARKRDSNG
ncbi:MAG: BtpA/SgcQ family protein [Phycisphaerales bacterium]|nr:BtpA/SgcQ family protein [Phycisphaerales bacterium]